MTNLRVTWSSEGMQHVIPLISIIIQAIQSQSIANLKAKVSVYPVYLSGVLMFPVTNDERGRGILLDL